MVEINKNNIEAKAGRLPNMEMSKKLEKGQVKEVVPTDDKKAAREKLEYEKRVRKMA